ncbi:hypothetical protein PLICRDRAFT_379495 [Plicaturopsis crispa FD-325 SS-3]|nr:hypothetical protein PLICRDRAFT_379495 [Plicaturopsis crispa FD-325 SS-3]
MAPSAAELSLRHLPDISDASFQIPVDLSTASGEFLLGNDNDDFLKAADDSLLTPAPLKRHYEPLTLAELTPKPKTRKDAPATVKETRTPDIRDEYSQTVKKPSVLTTTRSPGKPKLAIATQFFVPGSPVSQRLEDLKVGVEDLVNGSPENGKENITDDHRTDHASSRDNVKGKEKNRSKQVSKLRSTPYAQMHIAVRTVTMD